MSMDAALGPSVEENDDANLRTAASAGSSAATARDLDTACLIRGIRGLCRPGLDSYNQSMRRNANGSVDLYFGPKIGRRRGRRTATTERNSSGCVPSLDRRKRSAPRPSMLTLIYHMLKDWTPSITSLNSPGSASTSNYSPQPEHAFRVLAWTRIQSVRSAASDPGRTRPTTQS